MTPARNLLLIAAASGAALLAVAPASARTICNPDGYCFNTSGRPVYDQPAYHRYPYGGYAPYPYPPHRRYWRHDDYDDGY